MIPLDQNYNSVAPQEGGAYQRPPAGGYIFQCVGIEEKMSSNNNPMVVLDLDIAHGEFKGAFERYPVKYYQLCNGDSTPFLKGMLKAFFESNNSMPQMISNRNELIPEGLRGLFIGGSLYEEEYYSNGGELKTSMKIAFLCSTGKVRAGEIKPLPLKKAKAAPAPYDASMNNSYNQQQPGYMANNYSMPPADYDDDLPF